MRRGRVIVLRWISILVIFLALLLTVFQLINYSRLRATFPPDTYIGGIPVAGLDRRQTAERLTQFYSLPVEVRYGDAVIQLRPSAAGFRLDLEAMLAAADQQRIQQPFWNAFWDYLWNQMPAPAEVPLRAFTSDERLRNFLNEEIASRYDHPPAPAEPVPGTTNFSPGRPGTMLDVERAVVLISDAMRTPTNRVVNLSYDRISPSRPAFQNLQVMLQQVLNTQGYDGLAEIYLLDLRTGQEISFAYNDGSIIAPGIAFTAASTMKIPIMVSAFRRIDEPASVEITRMLESMIELSENDPADRLMEVVMDNRLGPLEVTEDIQRLGFHNTFLAGFFYPGAPLLRRFATTANQRTDIDTSPDPYNQTTPQEVGTLLYDIYQCANTGGGTFSVVFPGEITQNECRTMIALLARNRIAVLIEAGLPEGIQVAHKHGWITDPADGLIRTMSDSAIIYTTGGNYILVVYLYHPVQLLFNPANELVAHLSQAIYNYYNLTIQ